MDRSRIGWLPPLLRISLSWSVIVLGVLTGILFIVVSCHVAFEHGVEDDWFPSTLAALIASIALLGSVAAITSPRRAGLFFLIAGPVMGSCFVAWWRSFRFEAGVSFLALVSTGVGLSFLFAIPGLFWLFTARAGWRPVLSSSTRVKVFAGPCLLATCVVVGVTAWLCMPHYGSFECGVSAPVSAQRSPNHVVFVGKIVLVGRSEDQGQFSSWSVVRVERRFWGLPWWAPRLVILFGDVFGTGNRAEYFVDGVRGAGWAHFLPIIESYPCGRTQHLNSAAVDLRVLQDGPPKSGVRIIGQVYTAMDSTGLPAQGVKLSITGPGGKVTATTDSQGIYDLVGLPSGHYSVQVEPEGQRDHFSGAASGDVKSGEVWGTTLVRRTGPR
jgi:hypothetical protein